MSNLEELYATHVRAMRLPEPTREYRFHPTRRWRLDFAWPDKKFGVEIEGGTWINGRHTRGSGFEADCEKYAEAMCIGWRILRVTGEQVKSGQAIRWTIKAQGNALHNPAKLSIMIKDSTEQK